MLLLVTSCFFVASAASSSRISDRSTWPTFVKRRCARVRTNAGDASSFAASGEQDPRSVTCCVSNAVTTCSHRRQGFPPSWAGSRTVQSGIEVRPLQSCHPKAPDVHEGQGLIARTFLCRVGVNVMTTSVLPSAGMTPSFSGVAGDVLESKAGCNRNHTTIPPTFHLPAEIC